MFDTPPPSPDPEELAAFVARALTQLESASRAPVKCRRAHCHKPAAGPANADAATDGLAAADASPPNADDRPDPDLCPFHGRLLIEGRAAAAAGKAPTAAQAAALRAGARTDAAADGADAPPVPRPGGKAPKDVVGRSALWSGARGCWVDEEGAVVPTNRYLGPTRGPEAITVASALPRPRQGSEPPRADPSAGAVLARACCEALFHKDCRAPPPLSTVLLLAMWEATAVAASSRWGPLWSEMAATDPPAAAAALAVAAEAHAALDLDDIPEWRRPVLVARRAAGVLLAWHLWMAGGRATPLVACASAVDALAAVVAEAPEAIESPAPVAEPPAAVGTLDVVLEQPTLQVRQWRITVVDPGQPTAVPSVPGGRFSWKVASAEDAARGRDAAALALLGPSAPTTYAYTCVTGPKRAPLLRLAALLPLTQARR